MTIAKSVRATGRVQGVFFRAWTRDQARQLGITGWVRNCPDGSVQAHVEGDELSVEQMISLLRQGPSQAKVDELRIEIVAPENVGRFEVRY